MRAGDNQSAKDIAEELLERTSKALVSGDFDRFATAFHLPNVMTTSDHRIVVADPAHLRRVFDGMRIKMRDMGITELVRYVEAAQYRGPTEIASTHISYNMAGSAQLEAPYPVFSIIKLIDGEWRGVSSDYGFAPRSPQENALLMSIRVEADAEESALPRMSSLREAKDIHQAHLDALSNALLSGNFEAFFAGIQLPHLLVCEGSETLITTRARSEELFISYHRTLIAQGVTEYARLSTGAEFLSPDIICGQHETHILRNGQRLVEPYLNRVRLEQHNGGWYETRAANAVTDDQDRMLMPKPSRNPEPPKMPPVNLQRELTIPPVSRSEYAQD